MRGAVQCIANALYMLRHGIGRELVDGKEAVLVGLIRKGKLAAHNPAHKGKVDLIPVPLPVDAHQTLNDNLQPGFLPHFTDDGLIWHLTALHHASRQVPYIHIAAVRKQNAAVLIEDDCECAERKHSSSSLKVDGYIFLYRSKRVFREELNL